MEIADNLQKKKNPFQLLNDTNTAFDLYAITEKPLTKIPIQASMMHMYACKYTRSNGILEKFDEPGRSREAKLLRLN